MGKGIELKLVIPVLPHVYQYLVHTYGDEIIRLGWNDPLMLSAYNMLRVPRRDIDYFKPLESKHSITLVVPPDYNHTAQMKLTHYHAALFNSYIDKLLKITLFNTLDIAIQFSRVQIKTGIRLFLERNGIEESAWQYEAAKKAYFRYRKNLKKNTGVLSPSYNVKLSNLRLGKIAQLK